MIKLTLYISCYLILSESQISVKFLQRIYQLKKLSKTQLSKNYPGTVLRLLIKVSFSLMKNMLQTLAKIVLIPLGIAAIAADAGNHKKNLTFGKTTTLVISNHILKMFRSLSKYDFLIIGVSQTILNETKKNEGINFMACY